MSSRAIARTFVAAAGLAVVALAVVLGRPGPGAQEAKANPKDAPRRKPWTTSKITGSPEPPPKFKSVRVFPDVKLHQPALIARCPGSDRLFVGEQQGVLYSVANRPDAKADVFIDLRQDFKALRPNANAKGIGELYGLVFHPKFAENRTCYVCYTLQKKDGVPGYLADGSRVSRFKVTDADPPRIDPASEEVVITFQGGGHNGGDLHFGPDGMLYITTGDGRGPNPPDPINTGQDCSDLLSSLLRIDVDRQDPGKNYAVPKDNPFVGMADVRPEIWAYGFRNPWRMSFDRKTGELWLGDVGWELWEMVHKIEKGGNYGWSIVEGRQPIKPTQKIGPTPIRPPLIEIPHTIGASVTGGYVYRGKKFPELAGAYVFGDWETRRIWAARVEDGRVKEMPEIVKPNVRVSTFGEDNGGEIYYFDYDTGFLYTLGRNDAAGANTRFPTKLSDTGLFADVVKHEPAAGVIRFTPNARQWQDGATAEHLAALPGLSRVTVFDKPRPLPGQVFWHDFKTQFPPDAVLVKTISLDVLVGGKEVRRRVETQILHCDGEDWRGYTYAWRDDQTDADLVPADGAEKMFEVAARSLPQAKREHLWTFHSRTQCMTCHSAWSEFALAFNPRQLNVATVAKGEPRPNQLLDLSRAGYIRRVGDKDGELPPFDEQTVEKEPALVPPSDPHCSLEQRARSYLHVNCAHCHRFGGGGGQVVLEMDYSRPLKETGLFDVPPKQGDFGLPGAKIIAPGLPEKSVLYYRMAKFGRGRMPHLGSEYPDWAGLELVGEWISGMDRSKPSKWLGPPPTRASGAAGDVEHSLHSPSSALAFARAVGGGAMARGETEKVLAAAAKLEPGLVRDLFDGYLPPDPKGRKLGNNPRPSAILSLTGDVKRGEALFFAKDLKCANCHKVGDRGTTVGPDLTGIGKTRTRAELLDSLLVPSARVEPQFAAYLVRTKDEKTVTGLLVKRDDKLVIVRDGENKEHTFAAADVEAVTPSRLSLMPDGQVGGLTPQEAADLLEYLSSRK
jgi:putative heme-binding domain-containing protein